MPRHLLTLWNPSYADDALDQHLRILLAAADRATEADAATASGADEPCVWWAKLRSRSRVQPLPHLADILALDAQVAEGVETHLYLTDYRSLYVARLGQVTDEDVRADPAEHAAMPAYYLADPPVPVDVWFQLWDIRRLVGDDTPGVIAALRELENVRYHNAPVSLYGGMVDLPLIVERKQETNWFEGRESLLGGKLWVQQDREFRGATERMARELRDHLVGPDLWAVLDPGTRSFLASGEAIYRTRARDPHFDFSGASIAYAKAVEVELNALLFPALRSAVAGRQERDRVVAIQGRRVDLGGAVPHQSLGTLRNLLLHEGRVQAALRARFSTHDFLLREVPAQLGRIAEIRNPSAHADLLTAERLAPIRAEILGVGCDGFICRLARTRMMG
jgi:hypothetical protein